MAQKEDNFLKLKQQLKNNTLGNLYLLFGEETYVKDTYSALLQNTVADNGFSDFNRTVIENGTDFDAIEDALSSFPVMAEKKLVLIKDSGIFKSANEETKNFWQKQFSDIPDFVLLIFDEREIDKRSALFKAISKSGLAVEFQYLKPYDLVAWAVREANKYHKKMSKDAAEYLIGMCDSGLQSVKNELDKLINYCGDEIYKSDIEKVVSKPIGIVVFEITDAIMDKDSDLAMSLILRLKENKESAFNLLYLLASAFDKMLLCRLMLDEGSSYDAVSSRLKLSPFIVKKYINGAKGFSTEFLVDRVCAASEIDLAVKQGETDEWTAFMQYIFECLKKQK